MNITQLKTFITLSESKSYSEAAKKLKVTRPAVAGNIIALANNYGVKLFIRDGHRVKLSEVGRKLLPQARLAANMIDEIEHSLKSASSLDLNYLTIGIGEPSWGIELISVYMKRYPGVHIQAIEGNAHSLIRDLEKRKIDIVIVALTEADERFANFHFHTDFLSLCISKNHPWANRKSVTLAEICKQNIILPSSKTTCRQIIDGAFSKIAKTTRHIIEFDDWDPIIEAIVQGMGMGFLQGNLSRDPRLIRLKVKDADLRVPQYVICPPEYVELANVSAFLEITAERPARANNP
jgi:LysR family transcriptional regulator, low CO2-responsive transcriptional regulator